MLTHAAPAPPALLFAAGAGYLRAVRTPAGSTSVTHAQAASPLRFFTPQAGRTAAWIVSTTLGGGLVGGDVIDVSMEVEAGARVLFTTQASTKVYGSTRAAHQRLHARVEDHALLVALPDPVAPFARSAYVQDVRCDLASDASLLIVDGFVSGRPAYGDHWAFDHYASRVEVVRDGRVLFRDHLRLDRTDGAIGARMRGFASYAMAIAAGPLVAPMADAILAEAHERAHAPGGEPLMSASRLHDGSGVVVRLAGRDPDSVAATLAALCHPVIALVGEDPWSSRW